MRRALTLAAAVVASLALLGPVAQAGEPASPSSPAQSQEAPPSAQRMTRQQAMARLQWMYGVWSGPASGTNPDRSRYAITQTERIGPMLGGDILVVEGRGYRDDGSTGFDAFAAISFNEDSQTYEMRAYAMGNAGTFPLTVNDHGYVWQIPAGPGYVAYTSTFDGHTFREVGVFSMQGIPPQQMFEMNLTRRGDTDWPGAGAVQP